MDVHSLPFLLLYHPSNHLTAGTLRNCAMGILFGCLLLLGYIRFEPLTWSATAALLIVGLTVSFVGWWAFRLWTVTIAPMMTGSPEIARVLTRLPFWAFAGGIGYTAGLLIMKTLGWLPVADNPVKPIFLFGGGFLVLIQSVFEVFVIAARRRTP